MQNMCNSTPAGTLTVQGECEDVAVKVITPQQAIARARQDALAELAINCHVSSQLGSCVVALKGFVDMPDGQILIVMELAKCNMFKEMSDGNGRLPLGQIGAPTAAVHTHSKRGDHG